MAEPVLKFAPQQAPTSVEATPRPETPRKRLRFLLLFFIPFLATIGGLYWYLTGGRYISTDNAYVGSQKVLITPDVSGKVSRIMVTEGERVPAGAPLFEIDPVPFRLALEQANARVAGVRTDFENLKSNLAATERLIDLAQQTVRLRETDVERKRTLLANRTGAQAEVDVSLTSLMGARTSLEQLGLQRSTLRNQLLDDPNLPIEKFPAYAQASAVLEQARRDLEHATVRAPLAGTATQVPAIQLGRYLQAGTPVSALMDDDHPWVEANPKETDVTYLQVSQPVSIWVDAFPDDTFKGRVIAVSPGTGAQFSILPPQNASGNWVKVVQRLPVRIAFDAGQDVTRLRAGMSATVDIDTGRQRSLAGLFRLPGGQAQAR
jgi:membrane fusion protein (multidrug efflux system)